MSSFSGRAVISDGSGRDVEVEAHLFCHQVPGSGLSTWGGRATPVHDGETLWEAFNSSSATLRIGERRGAVIVTSFGGDRGSSELQGSGPEPF